MCGLIITCKRGHSTKRSALVELAEAGKIDLLYAPTTAKDVFYILPRAPSPAECERS